MPTRAEHRRMKRTLGISSTKMKRKRPVSREVEEAIRTEVTARVARQSALVGVETDPRNLLVPAPQGEQPKQLWVPGR